MIEQIESIAPYTVVVAAVLFVMERVFPLRHSRFPFFRRLFLNLTLSALTFLVAFIFVRPLINYIFALPADSMIGILSFFPEQSFYRIVAAFLLLDLSFYYWHRANHRFSFLWRFHNVHHFDGDLDVSTGARFHPVEIFLSGGIRIFQILIIGVSLKEYLLYELFFQFATFFHHSNLRLPRVLDSLLSKIIVTPRMHGIHHSHFKDETNSNYSVIFSFWDRLHRSFRYDVEVEQLVIGVPGYPHQEFGNIKSSLTAPFHEQKDYWRDSDNNYYEARPKEGKDYE